MSKKLFVGNLSWQADEAEFKALFERVGEVEEAIIIKEPSGRSKGFGFVTYVNDEDADKAVEELNGSEDLGGRAINVSEARPKAPREDRPRRDRY